jgi:hypothetical protein
MAWGYFYKGMLIRKQGILPLNASSYKLTCSFFHLVQLRRLAPRGHKVNRQKRQKAPFQPIHLMLVGSERAASAFHLVQLQGLEAHGISQFGQEGKERLSVRLVLCHPPLTKALPLFILTQPHFCCLFSSRAISSFRLF